MKAAFDRMMVFTVDRRVVTVLAWTLISVIAVVGYVDPEIVRSAVLVFDAGQSISIGGGGCGAIR